MNSKDTTFTGGWPIAEEILSLLEGLCLPGFSLGLAISKGLASSLHIEEANFNFDSFGRASEKPAPSAGA
jgi:hypothetical protein